jgi:hypothetical protein
LAVAVASSLRRVAADRDGGKGREENRQAKAGGWAEVAKGTVR